MNRQRGLRVGILLLLILAGCSKGDKKLNVEGAYTPVIANISSDHQPPVRGIPNALTALVTNPRNYAVQYHWSTSAGTLADSTTVTVHWTPPDSIGNYSVTVAITAHDDLNQVNFFKTRTFVLRVDNEFERWTRTPSVQFDVTAPAAGLIYFSQIRNSSTNESDIWSLDAPLGSPTQVTSQFWQATAPAAQSDGSRVVFLGKSNRGPQKASLYWVPSTGGDTTSAGIVIPVGISTNTVLGPARFEPTGSFLAYSTDTIGLNLTRPKPWIRDLEVPAQPIPVLPGANTTSEQNVYLNPSWNPNGDSIVVESFANFGQLNQLRRGLFKFSASRTSPPNNPGPPFTVWLNDSGAGEPDWSPNGGHIVFSKRTPGRTDRDIWIINAYATSPSQAVRVTTGPADEFHPRFSSDGSKIFFLSNRTDAYGADGVFDTERRGVNIWSVSRFDLP